MIFGAIIGLEPLCRFLCDVGRPARVVEPPDDLRKGFFFPDKHVIEISGSPPRFAKEPTIMEPLAANLRPHDVLEVRPEPEKRIVRIVHKRAASFEYNLFDPEMFKARRDSASLPLLEAFEAMAHIIQEA